MLHGNRFWFSDRPVPRIGGSPVFLRGSPVFAGSPADVLRRRRVPRRETQSVMSRPWAVTAQITKMSNAMITIDQIG